MTNENNTNTLTATSAGDGSYVFDCANFTNGWTNGDFLSIVVSGTGTNGQNLRVRATNLQDTAEIKKLEVKYT